MTQEVAEIIVVDDGSRDTTPEILDDMRSRYPQVRVARHSRPRGMEAAGQTGLDRATGELVFIQESNNSVRIEDLHRLLRMSEDESIVAARAESTPRPLSAPLMRRLTGVGCQHRTANPGKQRSEVEPANDPPPAPATTGQPSRKRLSAARRNVSLDDRRIGRVAAPNQERRGARPGAMKRTSFRPTRRALNHSSNNLLDFHCPAFPIIGCRLKIDSHPPHRIFGQDTRRKLALSTQR